MNAGWCVANAEWVIFTVGLRLWWKSRFWMYVLWSVISTFSVLSVFVFMCSLTHPRVSKIPRLCFYQTRSAWSVDQGSNKNHSPAYNFAPTVTKFCVMWEGLSLPHGTKFGNCRCKIVDSRAFPSWSLIHGLRWSGLIKAEPGWYMICHCLSIPVCFMFVQYIPRDDQTEYALLFFACQNGFYLHPSGLLHWLWDNHTVGPVPVK